MKFRSIVKRVEKVHASLNTPNMGKACNEGLQLLIEQWSKFGFLTI